MRFVRFLADGGARLRCLEVDDAADAKAPYVAYLNSEYAREGDKPARYHIPPRTEHFIRRGPDAAKKSIEYVKKKWTARGFDFQLGRRRS